MGIKIVLYNPHGNGIREDLIDEELHLMGVINGGASVCDCDLSPSLKRSKAHEEIGSAVALIFKVVAFGGAGFLGNGSSRLVDQLLRGLIKADERIIFLFRRGVQLQHFFHLTDKFCTLFRWNHPTFFLPRLEFVFFSVCRTVSCEIESTISNATLAIRHCCRKIGN
jgi:hypothetical protein